MACSPVQPSLSLLEREHPLWKSVPLTLQSPEVQGCKSPSRASPWLPDSLSAAVHHSCHRDAVLWRLRFREQLHHVSLSCWGRQKRELSGMNCSPSHLLPPPLSILNPLLSDITCAGLGGLPGGVTQQLNPDGSAALATILCSVHDAHIHLSTVTGEGGTSTTTTPAP